MNVTHVIHEWEPVVDADSRVLILGSVPSVKSRENGFYYGHPQNRFWRLLSQIYDEEVPMNKDEKIAMLLRNHLAVWDVVASCDIQGSSDSSIRNVVPNDIASLLKESKVHTIITNGATAKKYYDRYVLPETGREAICLPSTSPANAAWSLERLREKWSEVLKGGSNE